jgi:hypothetical protein
VLSGVQGAGPDWSESAENNAAYTSAGFHPAWPGGSGPRPVRQIRGTSANQVPGSAISLLLGDPVAPLASATVFGCPATV